MNSPAGQSLQLTCLLFCLDRPLCSVVGVADSNALCGLSKIESRPLPKAESESGATNGANSVSLRNL